MKKLTRILLSTAVILSAAAIAPTAYGKSVKAERNLIKEGNKAFADSNFVDAFALYEKALVENPSSDAALFNKAVTLTYMANEDNKGTANDPRVKAVEIFESIARTSPDNELAEKAYYNMGNMAFREGDYAAAIEQYKGALRKNPDNKKTRQNLRIAQLQQQEQDQNQDQDQDQDQDQQQQNQDQQQQQDQDQQQEEQQQQQQPQQQQQQQMTQSAEQILQSVQNKENSTRKKVQEQEVKNGGRTTTDKPW